MTKNMDVIELNGNLYDALTGAYVGKDAHAGAGSPAATAHPGPRHAAHALKTAAAPASHHSARTTPQHMPAHKPQRAHTLMRHAVTRPAPAAPAPAVSAKAVPAIAAVKPAAPVHTPKAAAISLNPQRSQRAQATSRSGMVSRFRSADIKPVAAPAAMTPKPAFTVHNASPQAVKVQPGVPVTVPTRQNYHIKPPAKPDIFAAQPAAQATQAARPRPLAAAQPAPPVSYTKQPATRPLDITAAQPQPQRPAAPHFRRAQRPHPAAQQAAARSASRQPASDEADADIFEHALAMARSHEQQPPKQPMLKSAKSRKRARRVIGFAASAAVFMLLSGFIVYQNKAAIQLEMASAKAGFAASAPLYKPEGYKMSRISYEPGTVETTYSNGDADAGIDIVQKKSNWDSQTLLENFVANKNGDYQGYQSGGRTVYVYGQRKATWVNGGTWYQLDAAGTEMNDEQLVKLAASM